SVGDIVGADVAVPGQAQVCHILTVWCKHADRVGPDEKTILVEVKRRSIMVVMHAQFGCIAGEDEILTEIVGDQHVLMPALKGIQAAVSILFLLIEEDQVELVS